MVDPIQTVTGSGIVDQAAAIEDMKAKNVLTARGQDISVAIANAQLASQLATSQGNNATAWAIAQLQAWTAQDAANKQYARDGDRLKFDQAQAQISSLLQYNDSKLKAQGLRVDSKFRALELLASRSGPQDWVAYNNILNAMSAPTGQMVDPTQFANEITDPERPDFASLNTPVTQPAAPTTPAPGNPFAGGVPATTLTPQVTAPPWPPPAGPSSAPTTAPMTQPPGEIGYAFDKLQPGWNLVTMGPGGDFARSGIDPRAKIYDQNRTEITDPNAQIRGGQPYWVQRLAQGGTMRDFMSIVGDASGRDPSAGGAKPEMLINPTRAPIAVLPSNVTDMMLQRARGGVQRYAGGTWQLGEDGTQDYFGRNYQQKPMQPGEVPDMSGAVSAAVSAAAQPSFNFTMPAKLDYSQFQGILNRARGQVAGGGQSFNESGGSIQPFGFPGPTPGPTPAPGGGGGGLGGYTLPINPPGGVDSTSTRPPIMPGGVPGPTPAPGGGGRDPNDPWIGPPVPGPASLPGTTVNDRGPSSAPQLLGPPVQAPPTPPGSNQTVLNEDGSYGMQPLNKYLQYTPEQLAQMPFLKKLFGGGALPAEFTGFGAPLSNKSLGLNNVPFGFSLQRYLRLLPSERDQVQSLYGQGLAVDFRDLLERIRRATPFGKSYSGPTQYAA